MKKWIVVHTQPAKEELAVQHLLQQSFEVYLPRIRKIRRHARKEEAILAPLFPRYLFVGIETDVQPWRSINSTRGVSYVLVNKELPAFIADDILQKMKQQEDQDGVVSLNTLSLFKPGEKVFIREGVFAGHQGTVNQIKDQDRVQILLTFLGRETAIDLASYSLENIL